MNILELLNSQNYTIEEWKSFFKEFGVRVTSKWDFMMLKYESCIDPKMFLLFDWLKECRGSIFRKDGGVWKFVCRPFDKFFNEHEIAAATLNKNITVQEKIDGSLLKMYYCNGWKLATNGCIDAFDAEIQGSNKTFGKLAIETISNFRMIFGELDRECTYLFEIVSPETKIVINYSQPKVYYLSTRNNSTGVEFIDYDIEWCDYGISIPKIYPLNSISEAKDIIDSLEDKEGFVIRDDDFNRVKLKTLNYLNLHKIRISNITIKDIFIAYKNDAIDDIDCDELKSKFYNFISYISHILMNDWNHYIEINKKPYEDKEYNYHFENFIYKKIKDNYYSVEEYIKTWSIDKFKKEYDSSLIHWAV